MVQGVGHPQGPPRRSIAGSNAATLPSTSPESKELFSNKQLYRLDIDLATARVAELFEISGTLLWLARATVSGVLTNTAIVDVAYNLLTADDMPFLPGMRISGVPFTKIYVTNAVQANTIATFVYVNDFPDDRVSTDG